MVTIGCGRTVKPVTFSVLGKDGKDKAVRGTVSYIHPARRYCILEFAVRGGILRESFQLTAKLPNRERQGLTWNADL